MPLSLIATIKIHKLSNAAIRDNGFYQFYYNKFEYLNPIDSDI